MVSTEAKLDKLIALQSELIGRADLAARAGMQFGGKRDLYEIFGYQRRLRAEDFLSKYARQDIAARIIDAHPAATWAEIPMVTGPDNFAEEFNMLAQKLDLFSNLYRLDKLSRLGVFAILVFGTRGKLDEPLRSSDEIVYLKPLGETYVEDIVFDNDETSPRFGLPVNYRVNFTLREETRDTYFRSTGMRASKQLIDVHHSRVVHITEHPLESILFSTPTIARIFNLLDDLLKLAGSSAEVFWLTANRGLHIDIDKEMPMSDTDAEKLADAIDEYQHQQRRVIRTRGANIDPLEDRTVRNPKETFDVIISLLSGASNTPKRILIGSEAGQLASEQDRANWSDRIAERVSLYAEPYILRPAIKLFQNVNMLPMGDIEIQWPDAFKLSPLERGQTAAQYARAVTNLSGQTKTGNMQITSRDEARGIVGLMEPLSNDEILSFEEINPVMGESNDIRATIKGNQD